jgi:hypothetical protein
MKKIILFSLIVFATATVFAQNDSISDVIVLKTGEIFRGKIVEQLPNVSIKIETAQGETFTFLVADIEMIGKQFGTQPLVISNPVKSHASTSIAPQKSSTQNQDSIDAYLAKINTMKDEFYSIGSDDEAMLQYLKRHDTFYAQKFQSAMDARDRGKGFLISGILFSAVSIGSIVYGIHIQSEKLCSIGALGITLSEMLVVASIPINISAGLRKRAIKNNFANQYFDVSKNEIEPQINFGLTAQGIGFTVNF